MGTDRVSEAPVDLRTAAEELGVHYQSAYKWVRSGRLQAAKVNGRYDVAPAEIRRFAQLRAEPHDPPARRPRGGYEKLADRAWKQLLTGDEAGVRKLVAGLMANGVPLTTVMAEVLAPSLVQVGEEWRAGRLDVATEHRCSAIVERVIGENMPTPRGRRRGTVVVAAPAGDLHSLPTSMAAAALREDNWRVHHLGANMPSAAIVGLCSRERPDLVVLTVTAPECVAAAEEAAAGAGAIGVPSLVGGAGQSLADLVGSAREVRRR